MKAVTVSNEITSIAPAKWRRQVVEIKNVGAVNVFLQYDGSSTVLTAANGMTLEPGDVLTIRPPLADQPINGIVASGTCEVRVQGD